jgi:hypothetical protein
MKCGDLSHWKKVENKKKNKIQKSDVTSASAALLEVRKWIRKRYFKYLNLLFGFLKTSSPGLQVELLKKKFIQCGFEVNEWDLSLLGGSTEHFDGPHSSHF